MTGILPKRGNLDTNRHTHTWRTPCGGKDRDWGDGTAGQGPQILPANIRIHGGGGSIEQVLPHSSQEEQPCQHPNLRILASRTQRMNLLLKPLSVL